MRIGRQGGRQVISPSGEGSEKSSTSHQKVGSERAILTGAGGGVGAFRIMANPYRPRTR